MNERSGEECSIAFKEWAAVCGALADGRQSIILRKGGIAEEGGEFKPEHKRFWLFPTAVHQQSQGVKQGENLPVSASRPDSIPIQHLVEVLRTYRCVSLPVLTELDPFHIWTPDTVEKRFHYREPGIFVLFVKVSSLKNAVKVPNEPRYDGCKTWVMLEAGIGIVDVVAEIPDKILQERLLAIDRILEPSILA